MPRKFAAVCLAVHTSEPVAGKVVHQRGADMDIGCAAEAGLLPAEDEQDGVATVGDGGDAGDDVAVVAPNAESSLSAERCCPKCFEPYKGKRLQAHVELCAAKPSDFDRDLFIG